MANGWHRIKFLKIQIGLNGDELRLNAIEIISKARHTFAAALLDRTDITL